MILKAILRTYILEYSIEAFFDKLWRNLIALPIVQNIVLPSSALDFMGISQEEFDELLRRVQLSPKGIPKFHDDAIQDIGSLFDAY